MAKPANVFVKWQSDSAAHFRVRHKYSVYQAATLHFEFLYDVMALSFVVNSFSTARSERFILPHTKKVNHSRRRHNAQYCACKMDGLKNKIEIT